MSIFGREQETRRTSESGHPVTTADGIRLGTRGDLRGSYVEVIPEDEGRFWLSTLHLREGSGDELRLTFPFAELDEHRLHEPGLEPGLAFGGSIHDGVLSDEQALEQREQMERELRMQRGRIDTGLQEG